MIAIIAAILSAVVTAVSSYSQAETARKDKEYQAKIMRNNAIVKQQEAELTRKKGEIAQRAIDETKKKVRREYKAAAGTNVSLLAAGNVDISEGSALDLLEGNYNRFADDMGELEYQKELTGWEYDREAQLKQFDSDVDFSNASYLEATAGSQGKSLLSAAIAGVGSYASSYSGGSLGGSNVSASYTPHRSDGLH